MWDINLETEVLLTNVLQDTHPPYTPPLIRISTWHTIIYTLHQGCSCLNPVSRLRISATMTSSLRLQDMFASIICRIAIAHLIEVRSPIFYQIFTKCLLVPVEFHKVIKLIENDKIYQIFVKLEIAVPLHVWVVLRPVFIHICRNIIFTHVNRCSKKSVWNSLTYLPFFCYSIFFGDYKRFAILLSQLQVIHKI